MNGQGCDKDHKAARKWFELAAEHKIAEAQVNLADMLKNGWGGESDLQHAAELYKSAADQESFEGMWRLQEMMRLGMLGGSSVAKPHSLISKKATETNDANANFILGINHFSGFGGAKKDFNLAKIFLQKASYNSAKFFI